MTVDEIGVNHSRQIEGNHKRFFSLVSPRSNIHLAHLEIAAYPKLEDLVTPIHI